MFTFFNKINFKSATLIAAAFLFVIALVSFSFGSVASASVTSDLGGDASSVSNQAQINSTTGASSAAALAAGVESSYRSSASVSAKASFVGVICQKTFVNGVGKRNGYGHVVVQSQGWSVDVIFRKNGKWQSTKRLPANSKDHFSYYSNTTSTKVTAQLRLTSTRALINEQMTLENCRS